MWLLVGGDSAIGRAATQSLGGAGRAVIATTRRASLAGPDRPFLDLASPPERWSLPSGIDAAALFAAVARVAACEADPAGTSLINVDRTLTVAKRLLEQGGFVLFLSTNHVFDGATKRQKSDAPTAPTTAYGRQKAQAEAVLTAWRDAGESVAILRIAKVLAPDEALLRGWIARLAAGEPVRAFADLMMAPVPIALVCRAVEALLAERASGVFQLSGPRDVSYADAARHLARRLGAAAALVETGSAREAGLPASGMPPNTTVDSSAMARRYGIVVPDVETVLDGLLES